MKKTTSWREDFIISIFNLFFALFIFFNGFSKMAKGFLIDGTIVGGPTKEKGIIAFLSLVESSWWKYLIIAFLLYTSYMFYKDGLEKFKKRKSKK